MEGGVVEGRFNGLSTAFGAPVCPRECVFRIISATSG